MDKRVKVLVMILMLMMSTTFLLAEGAEKAEHHFDWMGFFGKLFNSTVLFGGLIFLLRKPIISLLTQKSLEINIDIDQREQQLDITSAQLEDIKNRLTKIEEEMANMKLAAEKSGLDEKKRIEELGAKESQRILELTDAEINDKIENSIRTLKSRIADLTIDHFKKDIRTRLDTAAHEKIIEKNIESCGDIIERE